MAKQKNDQPDKTPQEGGMVQTVLSQYRQIAKNLHKSRNDDAIMNALSPILDMPQDAQIRLLKALGKEQQVDAADIMLAINTYAPVKEVRKEARRTLIHLEGLDVYPDWQLPSLVSLSDIVNTATENVFDDEEEDEDEDDMFEGENVIERFLRYWAQKDFALAFDLLTSDSPLREGLSRDEWAERRQTWATNADFDSATMKIDVGYTLAFDENDGEELGEDEEELDAFWSLEMKDTVSSGSVTLPELPVSTLSLPPTGRHWFWTNYTFREVEGEYRIVSMRDRGAAALQLSQDEVHKRYQEINEEIGTMLAPQPESEDSDANEQLIESDGVAIDFDEIRWFIQQSLHYFDNLVASNTTEQDVYLVQARQAQAVPDYERSAAYSFLGAQRLPDMRSEMLLLLGEAYSELAIGDEEDEEEDEEDLVEEASMNRYFALAEDTFREAITLRDTVAHRLLLIDLLLNREDRLDDAARLLIEARQHIASPADEGAIETRVAQLQIMEEKPDEALAHFRKAASLAPDIENIWYDIALVQLSLNQREGAEESFLKSIELQPKVAGAYADLATLYVEDGKDEEAINMLNAGIQANPAEVDLMAALSMIYISAGDLDTAEEIIESAEVIDPNNEIVQVAREVVAMQRLQQQQQRSNNKKSGKSKKRR